MHLSINKQITILIALVFVLCLNYMIYQRYTSLGLPLETVLFFIVSINFILIFFFTSYHKYKKIINPISIYLLFISLFLYSLLPLSNALEFSYKSIIIIVGGIISYISGTLISNPKTIISYPIFKNGTKVLYFRILSLVALLSFMIEILMIGYIPIFQIFNNINIYGDATESMTILHTFVLLAPTLIFWCIFLYKKGLIKKKERNLFLFIFLFLFINNFGRTSLLMFFVTGLVYMDFYGKLNVRKMGIIGISFAVLFVVMGNLRSGNTMGTIKVILQNIAKTDYDTSILESYLISYSSVNFYRIIEVIEKKEELNYSSYGLNALKPVAKLIGIEQKEVKNNSILNPQSTLSTYLTDTYLDFGIIGILFFNFLYGYIANIIFRKYTDRKSDEYVISWGLFFFCISMTCFFNAFNTMLVWVIYISNKIILKE